jgi:hypothetical protein
MDVPVRSRRSLSRSRVLRSLGVLGYSSAYGVEVYGEFNCGPLLSWRVTHRIAC